MSIGFALEAVQMNCEKALKGHSGALTRCERSVLFSLICTCVLNVSVASFNEHRAQHDALYQPGHLDADPARDYTAPFDSDLAFPKGRHDAPSHRTTRETDRSQVGSSRISTVPRFFAGSPTYRDV